MLSAIILIPALVIWPYRIEAVVYDVPAPETRCAIHVTSASGWHTPTLLAQNLAYPLSAFIFADDCKAVADGRPYDAALIDPGTGRIVARGIACANRRVKDLPCRVEAPPIPTRASSHRFILRIVRVPGDVVSVPVEVKIQHEWRSASFDALMSV